MQNSKFKMQNKMQASDITPKEHRFCILNFAFCILELRVYFVFTGTALYTVLTVPPGNHVAAPSGTDEV
jgi:hypothetical protein